MIGVSLFRRSSLLLLAAALLPLGVLGLHGAQTAEAQTNKPREPRDATVHVTDIATRDGIVLCD